MGDVGSEGSYSSGLFFCCSMTWGGMKRVGGMFCIIGGAPGGGGGDVNIGRGGNPGGCVPGGKESGVNCDCPWNAEGGGGGGLVCNPKRVGGPSWAGGGAPGTIVECGWRPGGNKWGGTCTTLGDIWGGPSELGGSICGMPGGCGITCPGGITVPAGWGGGNLCPGGRAINGTGCELDVGCCWKASESGKCCTICGSGLETGGSTVCCIKGLGGRLILGCWPGGCMFCAMRGGGWLGICPGGLGGGGRGIGVSWCWFCGSIGLGDWLWDENWFICCSSMITFLSSASFGCSISCCFLGSFFSSLSDGCVLLAKNVIHKLNWHFVKKM